MVEIEATVSGRLVEILVQVGQEASVGDQIARLEADAAQPASTMVPKAQHRNVRPRCLRPPHSNRTPEIAYGVRQSHASWQPSTASISAALRDLGRADAFNSRM